MLVSWLYQPGEEHNEHVLEPGESSPVIVPHEGQACIEELIGLSLEAGLFKLFGCLRAAGRRGRDRYCPAQWVHFTSTFPGFAARLEIIFQTYNIIYLSCLL